MSGLQIIDIIFIVLTLLLVIRCALRGLVAELMTMAAVILGLLAAIFLYKNGGVFLREKWFPTLMVLSDILAFLALFVIVFVLIKIVEHILRDIIQRIKLGGVDRFLGFLFGFVEGIILISLVLLILTVQPIFDEGPLLERSVFAEMLLPIINGEGSAAAPVALIHV